MAVVVIVVMVQRKSAGGAPLEMQGPEAPPKEAERARSSVSAPVLNWLFTAQGKPEGAPCPAILAMRPACAGAPPRGACGHASPGGSPRQGAPQAADATTERPRRRPPARVRDCGARRSSSAGRGAQRAAPDAASQSHCRQGAS